jgi:hypothetical protein
MKGREACWKSLAMQSLPDASPAHCDPFVRQTARTVMRRSRVLGYNDYHPRLQRRGGGPVFFCERERGGNMHEREEIFKLGVRAAQMSEKAKEVF